MLLLASDSRGVKTALNLGKVLRLGFVGFADGGVDIGLAGDDDPGAALALGAELLGDGLQAEHQFGVVADELAHLVHQEDHLVVGGPRAQVLIDELGKAFDVDAVVVARFVKPGGSRRGALLQRLRQRMDDVIAQKVYRVALLLPVVAVGGGKGGFEAVKRALGHQVALHIGHMWGVAGIAQLFVENADEDLQDGVALGLVVGLGIDVEQDHIGRALHSALDVGQQHRVLDLVGIKELGGRAGLPGLGVKRGAVLQQVGQDLDEVGLARPKEAGHPDAHAVGDGRVVGAVHRGQIGIKEAAQIVADLLGDDVFLQLLPDAGSVHLVGLDDAVDRAVNRFDEEFSDVHVFRPWKFLFCLSARRLGCWVNNACSAWSVQPGPFSWTRAPSGRPGSSGLQPRC